MRTYPSSPFSSSASPARATPESRTGHLTFRRGQRCTVLLGARRRPRARHADAAAGRGLVLTDEKYAQAARRFAERYAAFDPRRQSEAMLDQAEELLAGAGATWGQQTTASRPVP